MSAVSTTPHVAAATRTLSVGECEIRYLRSGSGPTVVFVHPLRTQLEYFLPLLARLGNGFDVVALDLPGHGRSSCPPVEYTARYFTDVTERFVVEQNISSVTMVGESIGASIGLALAATRPAWLRRVIALNP